MGGVHELIAHGGMLPSYQPDTDNGPSPRRKGVQQGATLIMLGIITTILFGILNSYLGTPEFLVALSAVIGFVGGPLRLLFALIFEEGAPRQQIVVQNYMPPHSPAAFGGSVRQSALPAPQSTPVPAYRQRHHTAEIAHPTSVTENTTRLLEKEPGQTDR